MTEEKLNIMGYRYKFNDQGINYPLGLGCALFNNCFNCPFEDCKFNEGPNSPGDLHYMSNPGNGIKSW